MECGKNCPLMEDLEESIACHVCFHRMEQPKTLTCLHSFCLVCITEIPLTEDGSLCCPICRKNTMVSYYEKCFQRILVDQVEDMWNQIHSCRNVTIKILHVINKFLSQRLFIPNININYELIICYLHSYSLYYA